MESRSETWKDVLVAQIRILFFLPIRPKRIHRAYVIYALVSSLIVGVGRHWDNPKAEWWQNLGLGSFYYIIALAAILWIVIKPLRPEHWTYQRVLVFVGMTSLPGLLYAIPVERWMALSSAQLVNAWFLGAVATWRVALLYHFLVKAAKLRFFTAFVATSLPITLLITILTMLNLDHVVFNIMGGIRPHDESAHDMAYGILWLITSFSIMALPFIAIAYISLIVSARRPSAKGA